MNNNQRASKQNKYIEYGRCNEQVSRNRTGFCRRFRNTTIPAFIIGNNNNNGEEFNNSNQ